ncbi:MAG: hypothetical protein HY652_05385 [Acidobacteria bacterium]|nr:hypothetical protein [Acidobacteriota bacterium]
MAKALASLRGAKVASILHVGNLLAARQIETFRRDDHTEPEKRLMLAVLEDAVACFQKHIHARTDAGKRMFRDAEDWILEENSRWPFSFQNICTALGLNPKYMRQGLLHWKVKSCRHRQNGRHQQPLQGHVVF